MDIRIDKLSLSAGHLTETKRVGSIVPENGFKLEAKIQIPASGFDSVAWNDGDPAKIAVVKLPIGTCLSLESHKNAPVTVQHGSGKAIQDEPRLVLPVRREYIPFARQPAGIHPDRYFVKIHLVTGDSPLHRHIVIEIRLRIVVGTDSGFEIKSVEATGHARVLGSDSVIAKAE